MKLIITADWHIRTDRPRCRVDSDWIGTQKKAVQFVFQQAKKRKAKVCLIGDIFDKANDHFSILKYLLDWIFSSEIDFYILAGNHDCLYHSIEYMDRSLFGSLFSIAESEKTNILPMMKLGCAFHYGQIEESLYSGQEIVFLHELIFSDNEKILPNSGYYLASDLLITFPGAKWIFTGDNHHSFIYERNNRYVINPGCLLRQAADFKNYQPIIYFVDTEIGKIEKINVPDESSLIIDEYLEQAKERDERISAFVSSIRDKGEVSLSFRDNLLQRMDEIEEEGTKEIILECIEEI